MSWDYNKTAIFLEVQSQLFNSRYYTILERYIRVCFGKLCKIKLNLDF